VRRPHAAMPDAALPGGAVVAGYEP
jgi:hypothetical protein